MISVTILNPLMTNDQWKVNLAQLYAKKASRCALFILGSFSLWCFSSRIRFHKREYLIEVNLSISLYSFDIDIFANQAQRSLHNCKHLKVFVIESLSCLQ